MPETRRLAVVLFADVAGYSALMQKDEEAALKSLDRFKHTVETEAPRHNGQVVQYFGDGVAEEILNALSQLEEL